LLRTEPGCCVKTSIAFKNGQVQKCFINFVHSDRLEDMSEIPDANGGKRVHMPYSLGPPRPERDNKDENCMTVDFAVGTWTFGQAIQRPQILKMLVDTASEGLQKQFLKGHEEVKKDFKVMRRIRCRGPGARPIPMSVKGELLKDKGKDKRPAMTSVMEKDSVTPSELRQMRKEAKEKQLKPKKTEDVDEEQVPTKVQEPEFSTTASGAPRIRVPKHKLVHSGSFDLTDFMEASNRPTMLAQAIPRVLKLTVELPSVKKVSDISLDVTSTNICIEVPDKFYLDLPLSYEIDDQKGDAKFDKVKQVLTLELPVIPKAPDPNLFANRYGFTSEGEGEEEEGDDDADAVDDDAARGEGNQEPEATHDENLKEDVPAPTEKLKPEPTTALPSSESQAPQPTTALAPSQSGAEQTASDDLVPEEELPGFIPADAWAGSRQGYFFGTGDTGLGYYRDKRQRRPARHPPAKAEILLTPPVQACDTSANSLDTHNEAPLIEEVDDEEFIPASASRQASQQRPALPGKLQQYVDSTMLLSSRVATAEIDKSKAHLEPTLDWHQTRQNLILFVGIPAGHEVAGLQLSLMGRRLTIMFCIRAYGSETWYQQRLRRTLCRGVDGRQWHAEPRKPLSDANGEEAPLAIVLRKVEQGEKWVEAFDTSATSDAREPWIDNIEAAESVAADSARSEHGSCTGQGAADTAAGTKADIAAEVVEDSAELDIAAPVAHGAPESGGGLAKVAAPALVSAAVANAAAQSAIVMGQAVLLRTRLMYELF